MSEQGKLQTMSEARLAAILAAYGAASDRWPQAERAAAQELLERSESARALLAAEVGLDRLLSQAPLKVTPPPALVERLLAARPRAVPKQPASSPRRARGGGWRILWPYGSPVFPAGALAFSMLFGIALGTNLQSSNAELAGLTQADTEQLVVLALAETSYPEEWQP